MVCDLIAGSPGTCAARPRKSSGAAAPARAHPGATAWAGPGGHSGSRCCPLVAIPSPSVKQWRQTRVHTGNQGPATQMQADSKVWEQRSDTGRQQGMGFSPLGIGIVCRRNNLATKSNLSH